MHVGCPGLPDVETPGDESISESGSLAPRLALKFLEWSHIEAAVAGHCVGIVGMLGEIFVKLLAATLELLAVHLRHNDAEAFAHRHLVARA